tara:strand:+ start:1562 stop:1705 length:144 start_codon:yes stop_codon:yes gene_type:complete
MGVYRGFDYLDDVFLYGKAMKKKRNLSKEKIKKIQSQIFSSQISQLT